MKRILLILPFLLSVAVPVAEVRAQIVNDASSPLLTTTHGTEMGRCHGLRGWVVSLEEHLCPYAPDGSLSPDSSSRRYWFDPHGNIVSIVTTYWGLSPWCDTTAYVYDHRGRLSSTVLFSDGDTSTLSRYLYNDSTDRILLIRNSPDAPVNRIRFEYSPRGWCKTAHETQGRVILQACYRDGRLVSMIDYDPSSGDPRQLLSVVRHDGNGNPLVLADALRPDDAKLQCLYDFDPYGNPTLVASENDTVVLAYPLYDLTHNWLLCKMVDNNSPLALFRRAIRYAKDSADFGDVQRLHDPFWHENNPTGFLEMRYPNGDYYLGNLLQGLPHGSGDLLLADGTAFAGSFDHGRYHGAGVLKRRGAEIHAVWHHGHILTDHVEIRYADSSRYTGEFHPDAMQAGTRGDSCRYNGRTDLPGGGSYTGEYALEQYDGRGVLRLGDGTVYDGTWEYGKPHGEMLVVMPNLDRHHAHFEHGRRTGTSTIEYINGDLYRGETDQQGTPNGMGSYTTAAGKTRTGFWLAGQYKGRHRPPKRNSKH